MWHAQMHKAKNAFPPAWVGPGFLALQGTPAHLFGLMSPYHHLVIKA